MPTTRKRRGRRKRKAKGARKNKTKGKRRRRGRKKKSKGNYFGGLARGLAAPSSARLEPVLQKSDDGVGFVYKLAVGNDHEKTSGRVIHNLPIKRVPSVLTKKKRKKKSQGHYFGGLARGYVAPPSPARLAELQQTSDFKTWLEIRGRGAMPSVPVTSVPSVFTNAPTNASTKRQSKKKDMRLAKKKKQRRRRRRKKKKPKSIQQQGGQKKKEEMNKHRLAPLKVVVPRTGHMKTALPRPLVATPQRHHPTLPRVLAGSHHMFQAPARSGPLFDGYSQEFQMFGYGGFGYDTSDLEDEPQKPIVTAARSG